MCDAHQSWSKFHLLTHMTCLPAPHNFLANPAKPVGELVMDLELYLGGVVQLGRTMSDLFVMSLTENCLK